MSKSTRIRINVNSQALIKTAGLLSNTVILATNAFLLGSGIASHWRERKRERTLQNLEVTAQVANAIAGLTRVVVETIDRGQKHQVL